jgi:hypothetical protein
MIRKVCMVFIDVVLGPYGVAVQALVALLLLVCMLVSTIVARPFNKRHLGNLEILSLMTSSGTLWLGAFFWAIARETAMVLHQIVSITIVVINVVFMAYLFLILGKDACQDYGVADRLTRLTGMIEHRSLSVGGAREQRVHDSAGDENTINAKDSTSRLGRDGQGQSAAAAAATVKGTHTDKTTCVKPRSSSTGGGAAGVAAQMHHKTDYTHQRKTSTGNPLLANDAGKGEGEGVGVEQEALPTGWVELMDESRGFLYYSNTLTGEVQWERPTASAGAAAGAAAAAVGGGGAAAAAAAAAAGTGTGTGEAAGAETEAVAAGHERGVTVMPAGWQRLASELGQRYYVSAAGVSQWEKPPGNAPN